MAEVATTAKTKRSIQDVTNDGADGAASTAKKPRAAAPPAAAETATTLNEKQLEVEKQLQVARAFHKKKKGATDEVIEALSVEPVVDELAGSFLVRLLEAKGKGRSVKQACTNILRDLAKLVVKKKLNTDQQRKQLIKALNSVAAAALLANDVTAAALLAASAPQETEKEEGHVEGTVDVKLAKGDDVWYRYDNTRAAGDGTPGVSRQQIEQALKPERLSDPKDTYAEDRGFEVRYATDATRCATATNKVVRGFHEEAKVWRKRKAQERADADAKRDEEELKAKAALAVAAKEKEEAVRKARYEMFGLTYSSVPPLPDGATDADLERLEDEDLEAMYGR